MASRDTAKQTVRIDRLQLNIPGLDRDEAEQLGKEVEALLHRYLPAQVSRARIGALRLDIRLPETTPKEALADLIARQICQRLP